MVEGFVLAFSLREVSGREVGLRFWGGAIRVPVPLILPHGKHRACIE